MILAFAEYIVRLFVVYRAYSDYVFQALDSVIIREIDYHYSIYRLADKGPVKV